MPEMHHNLFNKLRDAHWLVNAPAFAPAFCVLVLLSLAPYLVNIAADCPPASEEARTKVSTVVVARPWREQDTRDIEAYLTEAYSKKGNPLFCKTDNWWRLFKIDFDRNLASIRRGWSANDAKSEDDNLRSLQEIGATVMKEKGRILSSDLEADESIGKLDNNLSRIEQDVRRIRNTSNSILSLSAREATARLYWISSISILFVISAVVTLVGAWIILDIVLERRNLGERAFLLIALTGTFVGLASLVLQPVVGKTIFAGVLQLPESDDFYYFIPNNILSYLNQHLMPGLDGLLALARAWTLVACLVLIAAVTACLWLTPHERRLFWQDPDEGLQEAPLSAGVFNRGEEAGRPDDTRVTSTPDPQEAVEPEDDEAAASSTRMKAPDPYALPARRLLRAWQRFQVAIVAAALLLIVAVNQVVALYQWPLSLLSQPAEAEADELASTMAEAVAQLGKGFGVAGTLLLAALLVPAAVVLWRRAWHLALTANETAEDGSAWLSKWHLSYSPWGLLGQIATILAPAATALAGIQLSNFVGN
jgi:hypothetical protein